MWLIVQILLRGPVEAEAADVGGFPPGQPGPGPVRHRTQAEPEEIQSLRRFCEYAPLSTCLERTVKGPECEICPGLTLKI